MLTTVLRPLFQSTFVTCSQGQKTAEPCSDAKAASPQRTNTTTSSDKYMAPERKLFCNIVCFVSDSETATANTSKNKLTRQARAHVVELVRRNRKRNRGRRLLHILCGQVHAPDLQRWELTKRKTRHASKQQRTRNPQIRHQTTRQGRGHRSFGRASKVTRDGDKSPG